MKSDELQIGDYVMVYPSNMVIQVQAIHNKKVGYHINKNKLEWVRIGLVRPIPLTFDMMHMNFSTREHVSWYTIEENENCFDVNILCASRSVVGFFEKVHDLQHALRLCKYPKEFEIL